MPGYASVYMVAAGVSCYLKTGFRRHSISLLVAAVSRVGSVTLLFTPLSPQSFVVHSGEWLLHLPLGIQHVAWHVEQPRSGGVLCLHLLMTAG